MTALALTAILGAGPAHQPDIDVTFRLAETDATLQWDYGWYEHSPEVARLQALLDLDQVDGIYGPDTWTAHGNALDHYDLMGDRPTPPPTKTVDEPAGHSPAATQSVHADVHSGVLDGVPYGDLIARHFAPQDHAWAVRVMYCESGGNPAAYNPSGASGLFQILAAYWPARSTAAGWPGASPFDPEANVATAAWLYYHGGGPSHWVCR